MKHRTDHPTEMRRDELPEVPAARIHGLTLDEARRRIAAQIDRLESARIARRRSRRP